MHLFSELDAFLDGFSTLKASVLTSVSSMHANMNAPPLRDGVRGSMPMT